MVVLLWTAVALVGTGLVWLGSSYLESSSERLAAYYRLPDIVQGAVVVAVGSSFPELSTTVLSASLHGSFELGVAAIVGSALFNILVIPALSGLVSPEQLGANRDLVYKEAQFYMLAVAVLTITFAFAIIYFPTDTGKLTGEVTRPLALVPLILYGLYVFVQYQDSMENPSAADSRTIRPRREWAVLGGALLVILVGVEALVQAAVHFGDIFNTPDFLWGVTVVAAGTSIPDAFVSIRAARHRRGLTSIANVLGSNVFDLLVCIPAGVLIAGAAPIDFAVATPLMAALTVATIALFLFMRTRLILSRPESSVLLILYALFVLWIAVETFGVVDFVPALPPG